MTENRRLVMNEVDPSSDINFSNVPSSVWELVVETSSAVDWLSVTNIPSNLTLLEFGPLLSSSLATPFYLPTTLTSYKGPVISGMKLPPSLKKLTLVETMKSAQTSDTALPAQLKTLVVENPLKFSNLDLTKLPASLETLQIVGKYNCSLEKLVLPPSVVLVDVGKSIQPVDLVATRVQIVQQQQPDSTDEESGILNANPLVVGSGQENIKVLEELRRKKPRLERLHVILDDEVLTSLGDVWTEVLLEGRVQVRELTVTNLTKSTCLADCGEVFKRSNALGRKFCRRLVVKSETYSHVAHLKLASNLKRLSGTSIEISYVDKSGPSDCLLPRLGHILGLKKTGPRKYFSDSFGATSTSLEITHERELHVVVGDSPLRYETPPTPQALTVPAVLSSFQEVPNAEKPVPKERPIVLHTWTKCGYCTKQEEIIDQFKKLSLKNETNFKDKVEIQVLDDPNDVKDKRVDSFPTWVKDGVLIPGVQSIEDLQKLLAGGSTAIHETPPTLTVPEKPKPKPVVLHTWTKCGYCTKQDEIIDQFKQISLENKTNFNDKVEINVVEDPNDIKDERVDSFPTWVKDDVLIPGVQTIEGLQKLLV